MLMHHADPRLDRRLRLAGGQGAQLAIDAHQHLALVGDVFAKEHVHQGRLAGAVFAQKRQHLALAKLEIDVIGGQHRAEAPGEPRELQDDLLFHAMRGRRARGGQGQIAPPNAARAGLSPTCRTRALRR